MSTSLFRRLSSEIPDAYRSRVRLLATLFSILLIGLFIRLWYLQILQGERFRSLSENNRIAYRLVRSPRGLIYDRKRRLLADNRPSFNIYLLKEDTQDLKKTVRQLADITETPFPALWKKVRSASSFRPFLVKADVDRRKVAYVMESRPDLPGVFLQVAPLRNYRHQKLAGHLLGYLNEIGDRELTKLRKQNYRQGDLIGRYGVERSQEKYLRGKNGFKQVEVDAYGRELRIVRPFNEKAGYNIELTMDSELQAKAEELFADYEGSIVALDPRSGGILAMVSNPTFDPNLFAAGIRPESWRALSQDPLHPLENRAIRGQYPPGSLFKIVMAFAALEEKIIRPDEYIFCNGHFPFGNRVFRDWKPGGHGPINFVQSLAQSCDVYYYTMGSRLKIERIAKYARMFGLGKPTQFSFREKPGLVPSDAWKRRRFKEKWYPVETISVSIGQGFNLVTPLQAANLIATVANGGTLWKPYIVRRVWRADQKPVYEHQPVPLNRIPIGADTFAKVRRGLWEVVNGPRGTAKKAAIPGVEVAGKTGTAQVVRLEITGRKAKPEDLPRKFRDHGWFVAFAPFENPRIAIAVLAEHAGRSGSFFAPIARDLMAFYLGVPAKRKGQKTARTEKNPARIQPSTNMRVVP